MNIQWYPGNMQKSKRVIEQELAIVDVVIELLDARIPYSSKNPYIDELAKNKKHIVVLNKTDLTDEMLTKEWVDAITLKGLDVVQISATNDLKIGEIEKIARRLMKEKVDRRKAKGMILVPIRALVVGIPNVGKSTFINKLVGRSSAKAGNKPGVTRGKQWIKLKPDFELVDTPGILMPKFDEEIVGLHLAFTGAINDAILDKVTLCQEFVKLVMRVKPQALVERYGIEICEDNTPSDVIEKIAVARGFKLKQNVADVLRASGMIIDEFRSGKLGKITLETPK